jgi:hypothetical protein
MYDQITTADGVKGKVMGVAFSTKSVRAYIAGSPEWLKCEVIETHTTGKGGDADEDAIIEELHNKIMKQCDEIARLREQKRELEEKNNKYHLKELMTAVRDLHGGLMERRKKIDLIDKAIEQIERITAKVEQA